MNPVLLDLLTAARDSPDDDGPRLVLADWLEEHGDPRGEFVRLQVNLAKLDPDDPAAAPAQRRHDGLRQQYGPAWLGPLAVGAPLRCERGLVDLTVTAEDFVGAEFAEAARSEAFAWVNKVHLVLVEASARRIDRALSSPHVALLPGLGVDGLSDRRVRQL